ncbi:IclR family transcriptional regulator domain-containing protein [Streptomyces sp. 900116325]
MPERERPDASRTAVRDVVRTYLRRENDGRGVDRPHRVPSGPLRPPPRHPGACPRSRPRAVPTGRTGSRTAGRGRTGTSRGRRGNGVRSPCPEEQLPEATPRTLTSRSTLVAELDRVRERGCALSRSESVWTMDAVAVPPAVEPTGPAGPDGVGAPRPEELHRSAALLGAARQKPDRARTDGPPHRPRQPARSHAGLCTEPEHRDRRRHPARGIRRHFHGIGHVLTVLLVGAGLPSPPRRPGEAGAGAGVSAGPRRCAPPAGPAIR